MPAILQRVAVTLALVALVASASTPAQTHRPPAPSGSASRAGTTSGTPPHAASGPDLRRLMPHAPAGWVSDGDVDPYGVFNPAQQAEQTYSRANEKEGHLSALIFRPAGVQTMFTDEFVVKAKLGPVKEAPWRVLSRMEISGRPALMEFEPTNGTGNLSFRAGPYTVKIEGSSITSEELVVLARKIDVAALLGVPP